MAGGPAPTGPSASPLGQAWGYGIVLGIGFLFALGMVHDRHHTCIEGSRLTTVQVFITWVLRRYNNELQTSEMFSTAGRTVKSGLVASAVVSSWTWAATLLQSSSVAFRYGMDCLRKTRFLQVRDIDTIQVFLARCGMLLVLPYRFCCLPQLLSS
jgi:hypothetical protein